MTDEEYPEVKKVLEAKTLYEVLCVEEKCTTDEIKRGYKKLAMKVHPDRCKHPNATSAFQRISHAYQVLSDENKRADYDKFGENVPEQPTFQNMGRQYYYQGNFPGGGGFYRFDDEISPEDIFNMFFGNMNNGGFHFQTYTSGDDIFAQSFRRRQQQQRQWQQQEENMPFYKRPSFLRTLMYIIPILLMLFSNLFLSDNDNDSFDWENNIIFDPPSGSPLYMYLKSDRYHVKFALSRSWLQSISHRRGIRIDKFFYDKARNKADQLFEQRLRYKCRKEKLSGNNYRPSCEQMEKYHMI